MNIPQTPINIISLGVLVVMIVPILILPARSDADSDPISRVESGLLPLVVTKGQLGIGSGIRQRMRHYHVPGISVAVFENGKVVWAKGYGAARIDENVSVTETTLFQAASISKSVTAIGALRLVQDGALSLDQAVNASLISWQLPPNTFTQNRDVTLRGLLSHSAGITVPFFPGYPVNATIPTLVEILNGVEPANTAQIEVDIPVGDKWRYSGGGYTIVQQLLIDVTKQPFQRYMADAVLLPMGMTNSTFEQPLDEMRAAKAAWGHRPGHGPVVGGFHVYPEMSAAGLWTTATELALFAIGVHEAAMGQRKSILNKALSQEMLTAQMENYGLGVVISGDGRSRAFRHAGINEGFESMLIGYSELGTGAVVMTNSNLSNELIWEIIGSIAREYKWPDFPDVVQRESLPSPDEQLAD